MPRYNNCTVVEPHYLKFSDNGSKKIIWGGSEFKRIEFEIAKFYHIFEENFVILLALFVHLMMWQHCKRK